ncbi:hypothetical protein F4861DRAFT_83373 [Xylaria intraflava]|nr:hypothetical protein F4861DRAFT_83373 [Xylaria intraflava]
MWLLVRSHPTDTKMPSYPSLGLPLFHHPQWLGKFYPTGHHAGCFGAQSNVLLVREVAMMHIMDRLTDKVDWHKKVFDEKIIAKWRAEALAYPDQVFWELAATCSQYDSDVGPSALEGIMTDKSFDYCIQELQCKARYFAATGIVPTLDATATIAKSDVSIQPALVETLRKAFDTLKKDQAGSPDWHPGTDDKVLNLVHPSMYPLVYGTTKLFQEEVIGIADAIEKWAGKGTVIPKWVETNAHRGQPLAYFSENYQWLPSNVAICDDGSVKFTSYINNLHPTKYPEIYGAIEKLAEKALPMWDQCLCHMTGRVKRESAGRDTPRIPLPQDPSDENEENWDWTPVSCEESVGSMGPETSEAGGGEKTASRETHDELNEEQLQDKWMAERRPVVPEPEPFGKIDYSPPHHLSEMFKETGLQIIVKMVSIELTPEKPTYAAGSWHVEGQMNEHICATAIYYLDSENITTSELSFRMQTDPDLSHRDEYTVGQGQYHWLEKTHGTTLTMDGVCLQQYGSVETREGRLLAFPNVFHHCVSPFRLVDPTKPGHRRFIALWLVDPYLRIISTANVPPQRQDWWVESALGRSAESQQTSLAKLPAELVQLLAEKGLIKETQMSHTKRTLPVELVDMIRTYWDVPGMSDEDARNHREQLMAERTHLNKCAVHDWTTLSYNFCEH